MSSVEYEQWLYRGDSTRDELLVVTERKDTGPKQDGDSRKEYEVVRSWLEYSQSETWLMGDSRVSDQASAQSALPREHQVAVTLPKGEMEKWLVRPTADTLAGQLEAKLLISSENTPWLMSCAPDDDGHIDGHFSAVLSSPNTQWLCKRGAGELDKWLSQPKKRRLSPTTSCDPLSSWKTFQDSVNWSPPLLDMEHKSVFSGSDITPEIDTTGGEEGKLLTSPSVGPASLPLPSGKDDSIEQWLPPPANHARPLSLLPLFEPANPKGQAHSLDQWLSSSARSLPSFDVESEASLLSLGSDYELIDEL